MTESTSTVNASDPILHGREGLLRDCLFLLLVATLSVAPYVTRLGFYGDDWAILAALVNADDSSFRAMWDVQYEQNVNLQRRPTQILYDAVLFRASALNPLGYHEFRKEVEPTLNRGDHFGLFEGRRQLLCHLAFTIGTMFGSRGFTIVSISAASFRSASAFS